MKSRRTQSLKFRLAIFYKKLQYKSSEQIVSQTEVVHGKIKNHMEAKYPKAMISPFFKNFSKCTDVFENM